MEDIGKGGKYCFAEETKKEKEREENLSEKENVTVGGQADRQADIAMHCEDSARILNSKVAMIKLVFKKFVCLKKSHHKNAKLHSTHRIKKLWHNYVSKCMIM